MKRPLRYLLSLLCAAAALSLFTLALEQGDSLVSLRYLSDSFVPELVLRGSQAAQARLDGVYEKAIESLNAQSQQGGEDGAGAGFVQRSFTQGDTLRLSSGSGFHLRSGSALATHDGVLIDVTEGSVLPSGSPLTPGHRYLAGEDSTVVIRIRSGLALGGAEGPWTWEHSGVQAAPFTDVSAEDWYAQAVDYAYFGGLFAGMGEDRFVPAGEMNRAMMMTVLYHLAGSPESERLAAPSAFQDVQAGAWYSSFVNWAAAQGVSAGTGEGQFSPEQSVTREQVVVLLHNFALNHLGLSLDGRGDLSAYSDRSQLSFWAEDAMSWAAYCSIVSGDALEPGRAATRAEVASMLMIFSQKYLEG